MACRPPCSASEPPVSLRGIAAGEITRKWQISRLTARFAIVPVSEAPTRRGQAPDRRGQPRPPPLPLPAPDLPVRRAPSILEPSILPDPCNPCMAWGCVVKTKTSLISPPPAPARGEGKVILSRWRLAWTPTPGTKRPKSGRGRLALVQLNGGRVTWARQLVSGRAAGSARNARTTVCAQGDCAVTKWPMPGMMRVVALDRVLAA